MPREDSDHPGASALSDQCLRCAWEVFLHKDSEDSDQVDAQADLSLQIAHMSFCWFCHAVAHILECSCIDYSHASNFKGATSLFSFLLSSGYMTCVIFLTKQESEIITT